MGAKLNRPICLVVLMVMLAVASSCAAEGWTDRRQVGPFSVVASFPLGELEAELRELPALESEMRRILALRPCRTVIEIRLLRDAEEFAQYLAEAFPGVPYRRALFVKRGHSATVLAHRQQELAIDLRHECTHALLHADLSNVPLWLDEGLAEYFELPANDRALQHPNLTAIRWNRSLVRAGDLPDLEAKHRLDELTAADYRLAWASVHFALHGPPEAHAELVRYLASLRTGESPEGFAPRLKGSVPEFERQLAEHFGEWANR